MNDFETELRAGLRAAAADADTSGALAERLISAVTVAPVRPDRTFVTPGWRGWLVPIGAAMAAVAATVGVIAVVSHVRDTSAPPAGPVVGPVSPSLGLQSPWLPSASATPSPASSGVGSTVHVVLPAPSTSEASPHGFRAVDVFFATPDNDFPTSDNGWAIGTWPCSVSNCAAVLRTTDGGASWSAVTAPPLDLSSCAYVARCASIRSDDGSHAVVYNEQGTTYQTNDGGKSWTKVAGSTAALDMHVLPGTHVYGGVQLATVGSGCPPGCRYQVEYLSPQEWKPAPSSAWPTDLNGDAGQVVIGGQAVFVMTYQNPAGGAGSEQPTLVAYSANGGIVNRGNPCRLASGSAEVDATDVTVASNGDLSILCVPRQQPSANRESVVTSTDGGQHFSTPVAVPADTTALGSADGSVLFASAGVHLYRSADGGKSWRQVATAGGNADGAQPADNLRMTSGSDGWWLPGYGSAVYTTSDGGLTWTQRAFG